MNNCPQKSRETNHERLFPPPSSPLPISVDQQLRRRRWVKEAHAFKLPISLWRADVSFLKCVRHHKHGIIYQETTYRRSGQHNLLDVSLRPIVTTLVNGSVKAFIDPFTHTFTVPITNPISRAGERCSAHHISSLSLQVQVDRQNLPWTFWQLKKNSASDCQVKFQKMSHEILFSFQEIVRERETLPQSWVIKPSDKPQD